MSIYLIYSLQSCETSCLDFLTHRVFLWNMYYSIKQGSIIWGVWLLRYYLSS